MKGPEVCIPCISICKVFIPLKIKGSIANVTALRIYRKFCIFSLEDYMRSSSLYVLKFYFSFTALYITFTLLHILMHAHKIIP